MKIKTYILLTAIVLCLITGSAMAISIESIDKVSIVMSRSTVLNILGEPDEISELGFGLTTDIYILKDLYPLVGTGSIYDENRILVGQAFIFSGPTTKETSTQIKKVGFTVLEDREGSFLLAGQDDDTGQPVVVVVSEKDGLTIVMTFEKTFYDRRIK